MNKIISDKIEKQSDAVQSLTSAPRKVKKPLPSNVVPLKTAKKEWEFVADTLPKLRTIVERLSAMGYACFPAKDSSPLAPFKDKPGYTSDRGEWSGANMVAVRLDGALLLDIDGNKGKVSKELLDDVRTNHKKAKIQHRMARPNLDEPGDSEHYLFRATGWNAETHRMCASGEMEEFVDLKTGNQLLYIKPGKTLFWHHLKPVEQLSPVPADVLKVLRKGGSKATRITGSACLKGFRPARWAELESAINFLRENGTYNGGGELERTEWLKILSALKNFEGSAFEDQARQLWEDVSIDADEAANKWESETQIMSQWNAPIFMARDIAPAAFPADISSVVDDADLSDEPRKKSAPKITEHANGAVSPADDVQLSLEGDFTNKGELIRAYNTADNVRLVLSGSGLKLCVNQMNGQVELHGGAGILSRPSQIDSFLTSAMARNKVPEGAIRTHCPAIAEEIAYHPVVRQLSNKEWDGVDRVTDVLKTLNFKEPDYAIPVMRAWLRATIAAAHTDKGFSSKLVPVLVGQQNAAKSSAIRRITEILPGCFTDQHFSPNSKDALIHAASHWVQEWAEMDRLTIKDMPAVKAYISSMSDSFRRPYARLEETKPRQGTIIGTANIGADTGVLKDSSGNVRFAVLETGQIDIESINLLLGWKWDGLTASRTNPGLLEQFWLQIKTEWLAGETTSMPSHLAQQQAQINEQYEDVNAYDQAILEFLHQHRDCAKAWRMSRDISSALGFPPERVRHVGRALASATRRGEIESRNAGQRVIEYHWPIVGSTVPDQDLTD